jgi:hypothetical protein
LRAAKNLNGLNVRSKVSNQPTINQTKNHKGKGLTSKPQKMKDKKVWDINKKMWRTDYKWLFFIFHKFESMDCSKRVYKIKKRHSISIKL